MQVMPIPGFVHFFNFEQTVDRFDESAISHLAAGFGIEGCFVQHHSDVPGVSGTNLLNRLLLGHTRQNC